MFVESVTAFQFIPSDEYAIEFVSEPTATHSFPFHATPLHSEKISDVPVTPVQLMPSYEYAIVFVP